MDVSPFVNRLERAFAALAPADGEDADALAAQLRPAIRRALIDLLLAAAEEIDRDLPEASVDVRLHEDEPAFVVTPSPAGPSVPSAPSLPSHATAEDRAACSASRLGKRGRQHYTAWVR